MKIFLLSMMLLALPMLANAYDVEVDGIYYNLNSEEKTAEVTYQSKDLYDNITSVYTGSVDIPETFTYEGLEYTVTSIGNGAFYSCSGLTSVTIPNSVVSVADNAFYGCYGLPVEDGVRYAGTILIGAVDQTQNTYKIIEGTRFILSNAFYDCRSLTSTTIPNSVIIIGNSAFKNCRYLKSIEIGNSVTSIGEDAFKDCLSLTSVNINDIGAWCKIHFSLQDFYWDYLISDDQIRSNPLSYAHHLYLNGEEIKDLVIPNTITSIENCAFYGCSGLTSVTIPNSVTSIGMDAFKGCSGLRYVNISDLEAWCKISFSGVFAPDVGRIGVSSNPLSYAHHLYLNGEEIKDLVIPNTVTSIKQFAFSGCCGLTSVIVPSPITTIGFAAFYGCDGMSTITIPNSMTSIGEYAFYGCKALEKVKCYAENVPQAELAFMDYNERFQLNPNSALYVPAQSLTKYKKFSYSRSWGCFKTIYAIEDGEPEKCSTPSISYANKQLTFSCETEGVEYHYTITDSDIKSDVASSINLSATYEISVYASKPGYYNSDVATATLVWTDAIFTETTETPTSAKAITESIPVLIFANGGTVTVKSEVDGQKVEVYAVNGQALGASTIQNGQATIATSMQRGEIVIVKVGNKSVKVKN